MTDLTERLAEALEVCEGATEGPWYANDRGIGWEIGSAPKSDEPGYWPPTINEGLRETFEKPDAAFIAHARTGYPAALRALQAVLELHQPEEGFGPPGLVCSGCWGEPDPFGPGAEEMPWPCPTVRAITEHLDPTP